MNFSQLNLEDQYAEKVEWDRFNKVPVVLVFAGEAASTHAHEWGTWLQTHFNGTYVPTKTHLSAYDEREKIKVIPVATLPNIPGIFKHFFRSGFRKKTEMAMILDYGAELSSQFSYNEKDKVPLIAIFAAKAKDLSEAQTFRAPRSDTAIKSNLQKAIEQALQ